MSSLWGVDVLQRLRQFEVDVVEADFPLLDPASYLNALIARLPLLGFSVERRLGRLLRCRRLGCGPFSRIPL
jgi:hypothetical protein